MYIARFARPRGNILIIRYITQIPLSHSFPDMYYFKVLKEGIKRWIKEIKMENIIKE
jgi:hypothetical protein